MVSRQRPSPLRAVPNVIWPRQRALLAMPRERLVGLGVSKVKPGRWREEAGSGCKRARSPVNPCKTKLQLPVLGQGWH